MTISVLLPDINIWLALSFESHRHHQLAANWFMQRTAEECAFCRTTQQGYLRLLTLKAAFGEEARSMEQAWACYDVLLADERVVYVHEPVEIEATWRGYTTTQVVSSKRWMDAYLAAFAVAGGHTLVSLDQGLVEYRGLPVIILHS